MTLPDPSLPDLAQLAAALLAPDADLAPRSRVNIRKRAGYYLDFARRHGLPTDLADLDPLDLGAFVYERLYIGKVSARTASQYLWGVTRAWQHTTGRHEPIGSVAELVIAAARQQLPQPACRPAPVAPLWLLHEMHDAMQPGTDGYRNAGEWRAARDRALLACLVDGALRPGEPLDATLEHVTRLDGGYELVLPRSKTNQVGDRLERVFLADNGPMASGRKLATWLDLRRGATGAALFPADRNGIPLSRRTASRRLRRAAIRCGHTADELSLYSLRRTRATLAALAGVDLAAISRWLRHETIGTTSRYIDRLSHIVDDEDARAFYLAADRPDGADPNRLGRAQPRQQPGPTTAAADHDHDIDELRDAAELVAHRGRMPWADSTIAEIGRVARNWREFCTSHGQDPTEPSPQLVAAWTVWLDRTGDRTVETVGRYLAHLRRWFVTQDPTGPPPTGHAEQVLDALRRRDADSVDESRAPVQARHVLLNLAGSLAQPTPTRDHDLAVLRHAIARVTGRSNCPRGQLNRDDVTIAEDGRTATLQLAGTALTLTACRQRWLCPVAALRQLQDSAVDGIVIDSWKLNAGAIHRYGVSGRVEDWDDTDLRTAAWIYATRRRTQARLRLLLCVAWSGALRMADLREAQLDELDRVERGYLLHLGRSKTNRHGTAEPILLAATDDALCPAAAIDDWRSMWPHHQGPLLASRIDIHALHDSSDLLLATCDTTAKLVADLADVGQLDLTGHSLRRSRATHDWRQHLDIHRIRRLLRHDQLDWTWRYVDDLPVLARDVTRGVADDAGDRR